MIPLALPDFSGNESRYLNDCLESGWISSKSPHVSKFEDEFSKLTGREAVSCSSGTAALHLALMSLDIMPWHEVIVPAMTFASPANVVLAMGASIKFCDVDDSGCLDVKNIRALVSENTKAVIAVELMGMGCNEAVYTFCSGQGVPVIVDKCESLSFTGGGDIWCYSFFANKHIATGEGGMVCGDVDKLKVLRSHGIVPKSEGHGYDHDIVGLNYRMTGLQAAIGLAQLERLDEFNEKRAANVAEYKKHLKGFGTWLYCARSDDPVRDRMTMMWAKVEARRMFKPLTWQLAFREFKTDCPKAEWIYDNHICLPCGPHINPEQVEEICRILSKYSSDTMADRP